MREIKFRAWDKETKELSYDFLSRNWLKVCVESPYVELMQYTGLKDDKETDIYEGDLLKVSIYDWNTGKLIAERTVPVEFKHCKFGMEWSDGYSCLDAFSPNHCKFEVVGNVWEKRDGGDFSDSKQTL